MQTQHQVEVSKNEETKLNGQVWKTTLTIEWPDTDAPQWLIDIARKSIVISWQSQMRAAMNKKENPLTKVASEYTIKAENYKPKERLTKSERIVKDVNTLSEAERQELIEKLLK